MILNERFGQRHGGISEWMFRILNEIWIEIWKDLRNFWIIVEKMNV